MQTTVLREGSMDPVIQLQPDRCMCVLGPQVTARYLSGGASEPAGVLSYKGLVELGVRRTLALESFASSEEKQRRETLLKNAYELEPCFAAYKVVETLKACGCYEQWLTEVFSLVRPQRSSNPTLDHLLALQEKGMLLAYSHYDTLLETALDLPPPVLLDNEEAVSKWAGGRTSGILHLHGVHSFPASMKWDCVAYEETLAKSPGGRLLKDICKTKNVFFVGFDGEYFDPLLLKFAANFCNPASRFPILLTSSSRPPSHGTFLTLRFQQEINLDRVLVPYSVTKPGTPLDNYTSTELALLYSDNSSCLEAADKIKNLGTINASQLKLTQDQFHQLSMKIEQQGLRNLWMVLFSEGSNLLHPGLVGISIAGTIIWLRGRNRVALESGRPEIAPLPTLNTTVSVISSMWTPITSPVIAKHPSSSRPTLQSPLVCSTSKGSLQKTPELPTQFGQGPRVLYTHPHKIHQQPRRIQSEQDKLTYQDRVSEEVKNRKNGILIHRESAPTFVYTSEGCIAYPADPNNTSIPTRAIAVPSPSTLMKLDGNMTEHRIEYIDQYKQGKTASVPSSRISHGHRKQAEEEEIREEKAVDPEFNNLKQKFINEAKEWSKNLRVGEGELSKNNTANPVTTISMATLASGLFGSPSRDQDGGKLFPLPSFVGPDQERLLQQHFEQHLQKQQQQQLQQQLQLQQQQQLQQQKQAVAAAASISRTSPNTLSVSTTHASRSTSKSPKPSPILLPTGATSPLHPFLAGQSNSGVFSYFPNPSPAGFIYSPSVSGSQYAGIFSPYQAAMQMMASQASGKPVIVTDPSMLQNVLGDKLFYMMPDGTIASLPMASAAGQVITHSDTIKEAVSPPILLQKRSRSPNVETETKFLPAPKRRRSSSLPDIAQLSTEKRSVGNNEEVPPQRTHKPRQQPPTMIQIPKDIKLNDPMIGAFPTPTQGSPLTTAFAASPLILSNMTFQPQPMTPITPGQDGLSGDEIKDLVEAGSQTALPPSPEGSILPPFPAGRGPIQLWQFLLDLLLSPDKQHMIQWTGNGYEFRILQPEEIAKLWGARKNKPRMNYDKLSRGLRYYYSKGIMDKVPGKKLTFKYTCDVQHYVKSRGSQPVRSFNGDITTSVPVNGVSC